MFNANLINSSSPLIPSNLVYAPRRKALSDPLEQERMEAMFMPFEDILEKINSSNLNHAWKAFTASETGNPKAYHPGIYDIAVS